MCLWYRRWVVTYICYNVLQDSATGSATSSVRNKWQRRSGSEGGLRSLCDSVYVNVRRVTHWQNWWEPMWFLSGDCLIFRTCLRSLEYAKNNELEPPTTHDAFLFSFLFFLPCAGNLKRVAMCTTSNLCLTLLSSVVGYFLHFSVFFRSRMPSKIFMPREMLWIYWSPTHCSTSATYLLLSWILNSDLSLCQEERSGSNSQCLCV